MAMSETLLDDVAKGFLMGGKVDGALGVAINGKSFAFIFVGGDGSMKASFSENRGERVGEPDIVMRRAGERDGLNPGNSLGPRVTEDVFFTKGRGFGLDGCDVEGGIV
ncbi:hypothetical protein H0H93_004556, partial [Arthromyces matolae]